MILTFIDHTELNREERYREEENPKKLIYDLNFNRNRDFNR